MTTFDRVLENPEKLDSYIKYKDLNRSSAFDRLLDYCREKKAELDTFKPEEHIAYSEWTVEPYHTKIHNINRCTKEAIKEWRAEK